ncbi:unnamed protein product [Leptidea sinapis]|uniref:Uncharacterized protein n=1 Tax=Leptidea sinapis TaxID=189913 RepID=A0A5E4Q349_9NEOP|nr:unnamed protein product [Leptidea sinapis]
MIPAGNAPVIPLVFQENVGGGDHSTPGDPYTRFTYCCHLWSGAPHCSNYREIDHLTLRGDVASLRFLPYVFIYHGECSEELVPPQCGFQGTFFHLQSNYGMSLHVRCFHDDTTSVGNGLFFPLVLQKVVDH